MLLVFFYFLFLWCLTSQIAFYSELWQRKEYRLDRIFSLLKSPERSQFFGWKPVTLFILSCFFFFLPKAAVFFIFLIFLFLSLLADLRALRLREFRKPLFTLKSIALLGLSGLFSLLLAFAGLKLGLSKEIPLYVLLAWLILFVPALVGTSSFLLFLPTLWYKKLLVKKAAKKLSGLKNLKVIGITGSFGKTTTRFFLTRILQGSFKVVSPPANFNTTIGIAKTVLNQVKADTDIFLVELGAYKGGEIRRKAAWLNPSIGILTGINSQHADLFGGIENIKNAKYELIQALDSPDALALFNGDSPPVFELYKRTHFCRKMLYSTRNKKADLYAFDIDFDTRRGLSFKVHFSQEDKTEKYLCKEVLGRYNVLNILAALAVGRFLGMSHKLLVKRTGLLEMPPRAMQLLPGIRDTLIIDDSYSANPDGVAAAIETLGEFKSRRKILIIRSLIELGEVAAEIHYNLGKLAGRVFDIVIFTNKSFFSDFSKGFRQTAPAKKLAVFSKTRRVIEWLDKTLRPGDAVLLENRISPKISNYLLQK